MKISRLVVFAFLFGSLSLMLSCEDKQADPQPQPPDPCETDPCGNPELCTCTNVFSELKKESFNPVGVVTETSDGFTVEGTLSFKSSQDSVKFEDANVTTSFDAAGNLQTLSGTVKVPNLLNYFAFPNPVTADVGFFSGKYLNENRDFDIVLIDTVSYFVFNIQVNVAVNFGNPDDPDTTPLTLSVPVGGHITLITNYDDPFFYFSVGQDLLGGIRMGSSGHGYIPYIPLQPVDQVKGFNGMKLQGGVFSVFKILLVDGSVIEYADLYASPIVPDDPIPDNITAEYKAGINGEFTLSLPIKSKKTKLPFLNLSMPIAEASAGIVALADGNGIQGKAFINGVMGADNSWWPDFIPLSFGAERRAWGFVQQDGLFEIGNSGKFFFEVPGNKQSTEGSVIYGPDHMTYEGIITENEVAWTASMIVEEEATTVTLDPPVDFTGGLNTRINARIDKDINEVIAKTQELDDAIANYEFELSLRGLRQDLPDICNTAKTQLTSALNKAVSDARAAIDKELSAISPFPMKRCDDNLPTVIFNAASPYFNAIERLKAAAHESNDNETTRTEIEAALKNLIALKKLTKTVTGSVKVATQLAGCGVGVWETRSRNFSITVIGDGTVAKLQEAANNVKYITESSSTVVTLEQVINQLPLKEDLEQLKQDIQNGVKQIPSVDNVGFTKFHDPVTFEFFATLSGTREVVGEVNIFDGDAVAAYIISKLK